jgi:hypothetical protein
MSLMYPVEASTAERLGWSTAGCSVDMSKEGERYRCP